MTTITQLVSDVIGATEDTMASSAALGDQVNPAIDKLSRCHKRLGSATAQSASLGDAGRTKDFMSRVPPLAFEIARVTKDLLQRVELLDGSHQQQEQEDYS